MTILVLVLLGAMAFAMGMFGAPVPPLGAPLGAPPGAAGEELGQDVRRAAALLDVLVPDEHAASTILTPAATANSALAGLLTNTCRLLSFRFLSPGPRATSSPRRAAGPRRHEDVKWPVGRGVREGVGHIVRDHLPEAVGIDLDRDRRAARRRMQPDGARRGGHAQRFHLLAHQRRQ